MRKILVTGGTGLVGSAIERHISQEQAKEDEWYFASSKDANLVNLVEVKKLFDKVKPNYVIHLAAKVGGLFSNMNNNLDFLRENLHINDNVLQTAFEHNCVKVVSCLSTCIFPDNTSYPINETMVHLGPPHPSNYGYSYAKRLIDIQNHAYYDTNGSLFTSVIPCNIFGPNDNYNPEASHVIPGMIHRMHELINNNKKAVEKQEFVVYGSGNPLRQFIYSEDLARLLVWTLANYNDVEPLILSVDESAEVSILSVARSIAKAFQFKGRIVCDTTKADGQFKKTASNKKLRELLPDFKFTDFDVAIKYSVDWYIQNLTKARK